jgi:hypothetical protein
MMAGSLSQRTKSEESEEILRKRSAKVWSQPVWRGGLTIANSVGFKKFWRGHRSTNGVSQVAIIDHGGQFFSPYHPNKLK